MDIRRPHQLILPFPMNNPDINGLRQSLGLPVSSNDKGDSSMGCGCLIVILIVAVLIAKACCG